MKEYFKYRTMVKLNFVANFGKEKCVNNSCTFKISAILLRD